MVFIVAVTRRIPVSTRLSGTQIFASCEFTWSVAFINLSEPDSQVSPNEHTDTQKLECVNEEIEVND